MDVVTVKDKQFSISIPESRLRERVAEVAQQISRDLEGKNPLFLAVLNGAFMFAADLMRGIDIPAEISLCALPVTKACKAPARSSNSSASPRTLKIAPSW